MKKFIESTIAEVRRTGVTKTLLGRERPIPDMNSRNPSSRGFAERTAVNSPLQGTAADLIKLAMVHIDRRLREEKYQAAMLLQVHDELVFEAPPEETQKLAAMVKQEMEAGLRARSAAGGGSGGGGELERREVAGFGGFSSVSPDGARRRLR